MKASMALPNQRRVAAVTHDGRLVTVEQPLPEVPPTSVVVRVRASLISPGSELGGWQQLAARRREPAEPMPPKPFGYANAGEIVAVGAGVKHRRLGERVACVGAGYAQHTNFAVVPQNLVVPMDDERLDFEQGAYAHLAATGLHALRRAEPEFGELVAVAGLGLVGLLTGRLFQLAGNEVIGWDTSTERAAMAHRFGFDAVATIGSGDAVEATRGFTRGAGLDTGVVAFGGKADAAMAALARAMKVSPDGHPMGRIVIVGGADFHYVKQLNNIDIRRSSRPGPGYHDKAWEAGADYPPVFVRWTTASNTALCLRLMARGQLDVGALTTHRIPLDQLDARSDELIAAPDSVLGVVLTMND